MTAQELYEARKERIDKAVRLEVPDRVPIFLFFSQYPARHAGLTLEECYYDLDKWLQAYERAIVDLEPDLYAPPEVAVFTGGVVHEILGNKLIKWPGHGVGRDTSFQFIEGEYMTAEEYPEFLHDPSDFTIRKYLPRCFSALSGLGMLPPLISMTLGYVGAAVFGVLAVPPVAQTFEAMAKAGVEAAKWNAAYGQLREKMNALGFPSWVGGVSLAPFDVISDFLRGMRGTMLDMYRNPDELLAAQEKLLPMLIGSAVANCQMNGNPNVFIPLHRGADGFMSSKQFERFYWPGLKRLILSLIDAGLTPCPFFEGHYDQRLEYLKELPKGKVMGLFDLTDLVKAKKVIGDTMCIAGGMPLSLLQTTTPERVIEHTKKVIDAVGRDGGFIMASNIVLDDAKPELVRAWVETTKEYGAC